MEVLSESIWHLEISTVGRSPLHFTQRNAMKYYRRPIQAIAGQRFDMCYVALLSLIHLFRFT